MTIVANFLEILYWISVVGFILSIVFAIKDEDSNEPVIIASGILIVHTGVLSLLHVLDAINGRAIDPRLFILFISLVIFNWAVEFSAKRTKKLWNGLKKDNDDLQTRHDDIHAKYDDLHAKYDLLHWKYSYIHERYKLLPKQSVPRETIMEEKKI